MKNLHQTQEEEDVAYKYRKVNAEESTLHCFSCDQYTYTESVCRACACTFMVLCGQDDVLGPRRSEYVGPFVGVKELRSELWCKVLILEIRRIIPPHEVDIRLQFLLLPVPPGKER